MPGHFWTSCPKVAVKEDSMAKAYDVFALIQEKDREIRKNGQNWMDFLKSSVYTNKYNYNDQILIYASRPDAKACGSMDLWNTKFHRWVNKGAKGIPLLDVADDGRYRLKYVFDIADTHRTRYTVRDVKLWHFDKDQDDQALVNIERREDISPDDSSGNIQYRVHEITKRICEYEKSYLLADMIQSSEDTFIEELDDFNINVMVSNLLEKSVAYQLMERMELQPEDYFEVDDFTDIINFNSSALTSLLATSVSRITKDFLSDLSKEMNLSKTRQNNVRNNLMDHQGKVYNEDEKNKTKTMSSLDKGGITNEDIDTGRSGVRGSEGDVESHSQKDTLRDKRWDLSASGRDFDSQHRDDEPGTETGRDLRQSQEEISARAQTGQVLSDDYRGNPSEPSSGSGDASRETVGTADTPLAGSVESDRGDESIRSDEVGRDDGEHQNNHRRDDLQRNNLQLESGLQLNLFPTEQEQIDIIEKTVENQSTVFSFYQSDPIVSEPAVPERLDFHITDYDLGLGTNNDKLNYNLDAIRTLKTIESQNRLATEEEQKILSKYVGWGGLAHVFEEEPASTWAMIAYGRVKRLLTDEEYKSARESTLNAHYTSPTIIEAMYDGLQMLGFEKGNILEPSCGSGNFLGMIPEALNATKVYGVELDDLSGRIAKQLYQTADIEIKGFDETTVPDNFIDVAIGNVPFGDYRVYDKRYEKEDFLIHDFFFAKALDKVRPGGLVAFVTSKGTLDKKNSNVRKYLAKRAELLSAIRLPNDAFKANAGTEVTSDIIFLKKRERPIEVEPDWVHLGVDANGISMNQYFVDHPEMIMGTMEMESTRFGMASTCKPIPEADLKEQLADAVANISGFIDDIDIETYVEIQDESIPADPEVRNYSYTLVDGELYFRENSVMIRPNIKEKDTQRLLGLIEVRDATRDLVKLQMEEYSDEEIKEGQTLLNEVYDRFVDTNGHINDKRNARLFGEDASYALVCSLENIDVEHGTVTKTDMFHKQTIKKRAVPTHVDTAVEALAISIAEKAKVDIDFMAELTGMQEDVIAEDLRGIIFKNPRYDLNKTVQKYINADEYLSGNVREKLEDAKAAAGTEPSIYLDNVKALEEIIPKDLSATDIDVRLGAIWLPERDIENFIFETLDTPGYAKWDINVHYSPYTANWNVQGKSVDKSNIKATMTFGTERVNAYKIIEDTLNLRDTRVYDRVTDDDGKVKSVLNKHETMLASQKQDGIKEAFKSWVWNDAERRNRLVKFYNEKFNSVRPREFNGEHIAFEGMNPYIQLREHQKNAVARVLYGGNTLLAHVVGAGKSFEMIAGAMESKRLGLCQKSMFVVPNHLTEQMGSEFLKLYPSANILVATKKDFEPKNRKKFCGRIATGDYDAVVIGHSQFERIPMSVERQQLEFERQIEEITTGIAELKANSGERFSIKQLEKTKKSLMAKLQKLNDQSRKDDVVTFEELGVDKLIVDEAHSFKNLFLHTKMRNVAGIGQSEAKKSSDMFMKCRYMDEITNGEGVIFATGTPISNSMTELYTIQRYLQYGMLKQQNLEHFDAWASTFGETTTTIELSPEGTGYRPKTRFSKFYNLPELMNMFKEVADIKTVDMLDLPVPEAEYETKVISPSEHQTEMVESLSQRADMVRSKLVDPSVDNMLKITNDGRKLALDQKLMNPLLPRDENSKVTTCVNNVFDIWETTMEQRSTQLVFCDLSTPKRNGSFNVYDDLKEQLMGKGVPEKEIAFIHDARNERQKDEMFARVRSGDIRVLMGSTSKMGAGTNVQDKLIASHDIDCPWKPSDLEQRSGRTIRQGNENPKVKIFRYVTENTFDSYLWQLVENKQRFISQIMTSKSPVRSAEDVDESTLSYAEIKALATGNPLIKEKMDLDVQVSKLKMMHANYLSNKYALEDRILKHYPSEIKGLENAILGYEKDVQRVTVNIAKSLDGERAFNGMRVNGIGFGSLDKENAGKAILSACRDVKSGSGKVIGDYRGFDMELNYDSFFNQFNLRLKGDMSHRVVLGSDVFGNITRIDNVLDNLQARLDDAIAKLEATRQQLNNAKIEVKKPFEKEKEFNEQTARLSELDRLLNMDELPEPVQTVLELDRAKDLIDKYLEEEFDSELKPSDLEDLTKVDIAYTTTADDVHEIQASVDLLNFTVNTYLDDVLVHQDKYSSLKELNDYHLQDLDFESLILVYDADIEKVEKIQADEKKVVVQVQEDEGDYTVESAFSRPSILGQLRANKEASAQVAPKHAIQCKGGCL
jgi:N12 class adenine-specific DNA methylase/predicted RNA methylase